MNKKKKKKIEFFYLVRKFISLLARLRQEELCARGSGAVSRLVAAASRNGGSERGRGPRPERNLPARDNVGATCEVQGPWKAKPRTWCHGAWVSDGATSADSTWTGCAPSSRSPWPPTTRTLSPTSLGSPFARTRAQQPSTSPSSFLDYRSVSCQLKLPIFSSTDSFFATDGILSFYYAQFVFIALSLVSKKGKRDNIYNTDCEPEAHFFLLQLHFKWKL